MRKLTLDDPATRSADLVAENVEKLKALVPEAFTEGKIDFDVLKELLGGAVDPREEKYGLNWHGKRKARQLALAPSTGTLRPYPGESVAWDTTQNLFIEGDNLEVLKLLQKSYAGKVKLICIDPPYNTGKDFVYPDDFQDNIKNYLELTGQVESGRKVTSNTEASGRFHTDWLNMMYPRLKVARNLLRQDGCIFICIDDNEVASLRLVMDELFGPENFVATILWQKVYAPKSSAKHFSEDHDYIVVYAKDAETWRPTLLARTEEQDSAYSNPDNDPRGPWRPNNLAARNYYSKGTYAITCPSGRIIKGPPSGSYWRVSEEKFWEMDRDNRIWWGKDGNNVPAPKIFLSEVKAGRVPQTLWFYKDVGHNQEAKKELLDLLPVSSSDSVFETPKPVRLIQRVLEVATSPESEDIVMDFFGGSGTTGHAVMSQNGKDGGRRRFICVQLPERLDPPATLEDGSVLSTIAEMAKARIRRAGEALAQEGTSGDLGFRVFKLSSSNIQAWEPDRDRLKESLFDSLEHIKKDRGPEDVLYEVLLKLGLDLCVPIEQRTIAGKTVHSVGGGVLMVCLDEKLVRKDIERLALGIVEWHQALAPIGKTTCVFRDSAFVDDVAKSNMAAILEQHGLSKVTSL
jgi:adenine-specific DNA-methyltransferase